MRSLLAPRRYVQAPHWCLHVHGCRALPPAPGGRDAQPDGDGMGAAGAHHLYTREHIPACHHCRPDRALLADPLLTVEQARTVADEAARRRSAAAPVRYEALARTLSRARREHPHLPWSDDQGAGLHVIGRDPLTRGYALTYRTAHGRGWNHRPVPADMARALLAAARAEDPGLHVVYEQHPDTIGAAERLLLRRRTARELADDQRHTPAPDHT